MKTIIIATFILLVLSAVPSAVYGHPGRTDSSGGHTCRTNCPSWGLDYEEYHSHGGGTIIPPPQIWTFNGKTYYSYSDYLKAQEDYKKEQDRLNQEKLLKEKQEENKRLQTEIEESKQQEGQKQVEKQNDNASVVAGASTEKSDSEGSGLVAGIGALALLGGGGWYYFKRRGKNK